MEEEYFKDFDKWNGIKKRLDRNNQDVFFREKEVWWCYMGLNIGSEQNGKGELYIRPVCILKKINQETLLGVPLTRRLKEDRDHMSFYFNNDLNTALISQIRIFDKVRLLERIGDISDYLHQKIKKTTVAFILS